MRQVESVRVIQWSDADRLLAHTEYDIRNIRFDGTVSYAYKNTPQNFLNVGVCGDCQRVKPLAEWEGHTVVGMQSLIVCEECEEIREFER